MGFWDFLKSERQEEMARLAPSLGMKYAPDDEIRVMRLLMDFKLFGRGRSKKIKHLLWRNEPEDDVKLRVFDYQYTVRSGNSSRTYVQTVFFIYSKELGLPQFYLKPENVLHKIGAWLGWDDIDFTSHEQFSNQYLLKGEDEELVRDTFSESVLHYFTFEKDWHVEGLNYFLILYRHGRRLPPKEIQRFYQKGREIYDILKEEGFSV